MDSPVAVQDPVCSSVMQLVEELIVDWDTGMAGRVGPGTRLVSDLGFASIDVVALFTAVDERWHRRDWPYEELLTAGGRYVDDLAVDEVADFLSRHGAS